MALRQGLEYSSIENLWKSNGVQGKGIERGPEYGYSRPELGLVREWVVTEKVDGTNVRVLYSPGRPPWDGTLGAEAEVRFAGRTDKADLHGHLVEYLEGEFTDRKMWEAFARPVQEHDHLEAPHVVLYGEGFGAGIQRAGVHYGPDKRFILFDVLVLDSWEADTGWWLGWSDVKDVARKLGVPHVPELAAGASLDEAMSLVRASQLLRSTEASAHVEGVVCRTDPYLFDGRGRRVMFKYKVRDLRPGDEPHRVRDEEMSQFRAPRRDAATADFRGYMT